MAAELRGIMPPHPANVASFSSGCVRLWKGGILAKIFFIVKALAADKVARWARVICGTVLARMLPETCFREGGHLRLEHGWCGAMSPNPVGSVYLSLTTLLEKYTIDGFLWRGARVAKGGRL